MKLRTGGYQCKICFLKSGYGWVNEPDDPPSCCGVLMIAYEYLDKREKR